MEASDRIVLDTDVLVASLRGKDDVLRELAQSSLATSIISAFELFHGAFKSRESETNVSATRGLLSSLELLGVDLKVAERAGETLAEIQKLGRSVEIRDLLIGCTAREKGYSVLTYNGKHFRAIPGLRVIDRPHPR